MIRESLLSELQFEADNTRKLFKAVPDDVLNYKPNDFNWTIAQLCAHIAQLYNWWHATLHLDVFDLSAYDYNPGDISNMKAIKVKLEENIAAAIKSLDDYPEEKFMGTWSLTNKETVLMPPMPRIQVIRSYLMNHLYHHRGELVAFLRVNGKKVPGLYGPSYEEQMAMDKSVN